MHGFCTSSLIRAERKRVNQSARIALAATVYFAARKGFEIDTLIKFRAMLFSFSYPNNHALKPNYKYLS